MTTSAKLVKSLSRSLLPGVAALMMNTTATASDEASDEHAAPAVARSGAELAKTCTACHGETGISISPDFPNIAGQYASYLVYAMKGYRSGERSNAVMQSFVANLSDKELANLAEFYAAQPGLDTLTVKD